MNSLARVLFTVSMFTIVAVCGAAKEKEGQESRQSQMQEPFHVPNLDDAQALLPTKSEIEKLLPSSSQRNYPSKVFHIQHITVATKDEKGRTSVTASLHDPPPSSKQQHDHSRSKLPYIGTSRVFTSITHDVGPSHPRNQNHLAPVPIQHSAEGHKAVSEPRGYENRKIVRESQFPVTPQVIPHQRTPTVNTIHSSPEFHSDVPNDHSRKFKRPVETYPSIKSSVSMRDHPSRPHGQRVVAEVGVHKGKMYTNEGYDYLLSSPRIVKPSTLELRIPQEPHSNEERIRDSSNSNLEAYSGPTEVHSKGLLEAHFVPENLDHRQEGHPLMVQEESYSGYVQPAKLILPAREHHEPASPRLNSAPESFPQGDRVIHDHPPHHRSPPGNSRYTDPQPLPEDGVLHIKIEPDSSSADAEGSGVTSKPYEGHHTLRQDPAFQPEYAQGHVHTVREGSTQGGHIHSSPENYYGIQKTSEYHVPQDEGYRPKTDPNTYERYHTRNHDHAQDAQHAGSHTSAANINRYEHNYEVKKDDVLGDLSSLGYFALEPVRQEGYATEQVHSYGGAEHDKNCRHHAGQISPHEYEYRSQGHH